jgi:hypothetical protein
MKAEQKDMSVGEALQLLKDKGYTVEEICAALVELGKRRKEPKAKDGTTCFGGRPHRFGAEDRCVFCDALEPDAWQQQPTRESNAAERVEQNRK